jgi:glucan 1,3-beta-glucosidase
MFKKQTLIGSLGLAAVAAKSDKPFINGTNIGGLMVLEPWITPSLFYRFLGKTENDGVGMDSWTLCEALGPKEGNSLMRAHWDSWYTEEDFKNLAKRGVDMVRLPIGDWTLDPYGPYVGCMDGAADKIQWVFDMCEKYEIKVLLDVHGLKGSQNGFDNSGKTDKLEWKDQNNFSHWPNSEADWIGHWNLTTNKYDSIDYANIKASVDKSEALLKKWGSHPAFGAFEPVNEPWWSTPIDTLKQFYRDVRPLVQKHAPNATFVFHDAFHFDQNMWNDLFDDFENVALDHHYYQAWYGKNEDEGSYCGSYWDESGHAYDFKMDVWFGEWAFATDVCAHWLGGFNDGNTTPQFECKWVDCPKSYLPDSHAVDFDRTAATLGPYGSGDKKYYTVQNGKCSTDSDFFTHD